MTPLWTSPQQEHEPLKRSIVYVVAITTVLSVAVYVALYGWTFRSLWQGTSLGVAASLALHTSWNHLLWRWGWFCLGRPKVWGTWKGELQGHYRRDDQAGTIHVTVPVYVVIRQSATNATYEQLQDQSRSHTLYSRLTQRDGKWCLVGAYQNYPSDQTLEQHRGSFDLILTNNEVEGAYWSERWSKGTIRLTQRKPAFAATLADAKRLFEEETP